MSQYFEEDDQPVGAATPEEIEAEILFGDQEEPEEDFCQFCGKNIYDFSDLGCARCDARCRL